MVTKGSIPRPPLGEMPLIDLPFKRVAIDQVGPITPASKKWHKYSMTLVDYAARYPEAVPIKNIDTETAAEALLDMCSRVGVPEEVLKRSWDSVCFQMYEGSSKAAINQAFDYYSIPFNLQ